ncbi:unnamed protein product [Rangifer tarandus platyrhynchus]|uniref:Uncharacterized protein n=2 Tax=Rangifer tarandus platyrhynchus TaxID=3082113 RepID=A0ABN8Y094_RANTA|nr:unnamed protein product [Rangifer tarandus platyrhynchus]CAI9692668.1 unnamed protein product [Rangifer tarandus platyrhynchus]
MRTERRPPAPADRPWEGSAPSWGSQDTVSPSPQDLPQSRGSADSLTLLLAGRRPQPTRQTLREGPRCVPDPSEGDRTEQEMETVISCSEAAAGITGAQPRARSTSAISPCERERTGVETAAAKMAVLPARVTTGSEGPAGTGP